MNKKNSIDLAHYNNDWFNIGAPKWKAGLWYFINLLFFQNPLNPLSGIKVKLLRLFGAKIGRGVVIKPGVNIKYPWHLSIGDHSWVGERVWIDNLTTVHIGNHVCLSQGAMLLTGNHNYKSPTFDLMIGAIHLEDGVWIGAQSLVCPGVNCKSHAVLGACSMANRDLEPYGIYHGSPATFVRKRELSLL